MFTRVAILRLICVVALAVEVLIQVAILQRTCPLCTSRRWSSPIPMFNPIRRTGSDPSTDRDVSAANAAAKAAGPGVPLIWIQSRLIFGSVTAESFDGLLSRTARIA